ncbi:hypothetical protein BGZ57DRAFT_958057 [Hyaloscypha finlandica]|nr:hypothetical protein BGZ57DRAFT_958057 [Hyaloscypha finlandica]
MPATVIAEASFVFTILTFVTTGLGSLNSLRHVFAQFRREMERLQLAFAVHEEELKAWDTAWNFNNFPDDVYRFLWGQRYDDIRTARAAVERNLNGLNAHMLRVLDIKHDDPEWRRNLALHRKKILGRFTYALFSRDSLTKKFTRIEDSIKSLQTLSQQRLNLISGPKLGTNTIDPRVATRLGNLHQFGKDLFYQLRLLPLTSEWGLELRPPETGSDIERWQTQRVFRVWFSFRVDGPQDPGWRRIILQYSLWAQSSPPDWSNRVVNNDLHPSPQEFNPTVSKSPPHAQKTRPFRTLFKQQFFQTRWDLKQWQADQAHLLLSLSNWTALLWTSDWTTNLCCSGIRFVRVEAEAGAASDQCHCFHSLTIQQGHERQVPQVQGQQGQQVQQVQQAGNEECHHRDLKLKNIGLALAEAICATPFQSSTTDISQYQKWDAGRWVEIDGKGLLNMVKDKSLSEDLCEAVDFCLTEKDPGNKADNIASFYLDYIENVFTPIKTWCARRQKNGTQYMDPILNLFYGRRWPNEAFEDQVAA